MLSTPFGRKNCRCPGRSQPLVRRVKHHKQRNASHPKNNQQQRPPTINPGTILRVHPSTNLSSQILSETPPLPPDRHTTPHPRRTPAPTARHITAWGQRPRKQFRAKHTAAGRSAAVVGARHPRFLLERHQSGSKGMMVLPQRIYLPPAHLLLRGCNAEK